MLLWIWQCLCIYGSPRHVNFNGIRLALHGVAEGQSVALLWKKQQGQQWTDRFPTRSLTANHPSAATTTAATTTAAAAAPAVTAYIYNCIVAIVRIQCTERQWCWYREREIRPVVTPGTRTSMSGYNS